MEERELPVGWVADFLGSHATFEMGQAPPGSASNFESDGEIFVKAGEFGPRRPIIREWTTKPLKYASNGDVLICVVGATAGKLNLGIDCAISRSVAAIRPRESLDQLFLYFQLLLSVMTLREASTGSAQGVISKKMLAEIPLRVPPLNEQRRIAAKLDTTLAAVDACRQRLEGVAELLKRFLQAVLEAATTGELTREWREEKGIDECAMSVRLGDVIIGMRNGLSPKPSPTPPGAKILRIGAIRPGCVDLGDHRYLDLPVKDLEAYSLRVGDLIFTRYNGTLEFVGVCGLVRELDDFYVYPDKLIRVRCDSERALSAYVAIAFSTPSVRAQIESLVKSSAGQKGVSGADLKGVRFSLPPLEEQHEIVRRAQQLFSLADQLEAKLTAARQVVERLTPALLAKAFRGELVPQDPTDEPASVLLERIRAARQADAPAGNPSRRGRRKAAATPAPSLFDAAPAPPDQLATLLRECGALSEKALLAASELEPQRFAAQLTLEHHTGRIRPCWEDGEEMWEALG